MQLHAMPRCHSAGDEAAAGLQTLEAGIPDWGANMLQDDVHPFAASKSSHARQDVFTPVIDPRLYPQGPGFLQFLRVAGRSDHTRPEGATELNGEGADATPSGGNKHPFPPTHGSSVHHPLPGGHARHWPGRAFVKGTSLWEPIATVTRGHRELSIVPST